MSRALPRCATCGKPLAHIGGRVLMSFHAVVGIPVFGYCANEEPYTCADGVPPMHGPTKAKLSSVLRMIAARGPGRVSLTYRPSLGREITIDEACASADAIDSKEKQ